MGNPDLDKAKKEVDAITRPIKNPRRALKAGLKKITASTKADIIRRRDAAVDEAKADMEAVVHFEQNIDDFIAGVFDGADAE